MNIGDILILAGLAVWLILAVRAVRKQHRHGGCIGCHVEGCGKKQCTKMR